jgi:hypothetical protein
MISFLFDNPSKKLAVISVKGLHFVIIKLLTLKDYMVALLESDLGFVINCC